ncbi:hypothetical protein [Cytobacillus praedii]|uniref:hypothetical protein n=1 Tax=Cytobacillus praedii TaxID=1742358 RepID=UPI002E1CB343|nr:hypothetical protein [Cytobacillus praedii]
MAKYCQGVKTEVISDLVGEIDNGLDEISEEVNMLELVDWNEIFETMPDSEQIQSDIESAIGNIRGVLDNLKR